MKKCLIVSVVSGFITVTSTSIYAKEKEEVQQTRIGWLASCPNDPPVVPGVDSRSAFAVALVTAIGAKVIDGAIDSAAGALQAAGETKTVVTTAKSATDFYEITPNADLKVKNTCLVIVRGVFDENKESLVQWAENSDDFKGLQSVSFQLEAKLNALRGLKYFQLVPQYLKVGEFQESSWFGPKDRDFIVALSLTVPGGTGPFGSAEMSFKNVTRNTEWKSNAWELRSAASLPIAFPGESADATKAKNKREAELAPLLLAQDILDEVPAKSFANAPDIYDDAIVQQKVKLVCEGIDLENRRLNDDHQLIDDRCAYRVTQATAILDKALEDAHRNESRRAWANSVCKLDANLKDYSTATKCTNEPVAKDTVAKSFTYFTTQLTLSETREGSKFAKFMGNVLSSSKPELSNALQTKLLPKSQTVKDEEKVAARVARESLLVADLEVTKAEEGLADVLLKDPQVPIDITSARITLLKAKITVNEAYRKADLPVPYPEIGE